MRTERNKGRAYELLGMTNGSHTDTEWLHITLKILAFLLNRYINED